MKRIAIIIAAVCIILGGRLMPAAAAGENSQVPVAYTEGDYKYVETDSGAAIVDCDLEISGAITLPSELGGEPVVEIRDYAFAFCEGLTSVTIPSGVRSIGQGAFMDCPALKSATVPESVVRIGGSAFSLCTALESIVLPSGISAIYDGTFGGCYALKNVNIPSGVTEIGRSAFLECYALTDITIPDGVTIITESTFNGCGGLRSVTIPESVTAIDLWAFYECNALSDIYYGGSEAQWDMVSIGGEGNSALENADVHFGSDSFGSVSFANIGMPFTDVSESDWFYDAVRYVYSNDLMNGMTVTEFSPRENLTRAMMAAILYRIDGERVVSGSISEMFTDCSDRAWYAEAVLWAAQSNVVNGMGNRTFAPDDTMTRENIALMLYRYSGSPGTSSSSLDFADAADVDTWAYSAVVWATENGILAGDDNGRLNPRAAATRAETAAILSRYAER